MTRPDPQRLRRLKEAAFRAKAGPGCRICKGATHSPDHPYCLRHFRMLSPVADGSDLMSAVSRNERLDEADDIIELRALFPNAHYFASGHLNFGAGLTLRQSRRNGAECWVLRQTENFAERELGTYATVRAAMMDMKEHRKSASAHNSYAKKAFIR